MTHTLTLTFSFYIDICILCITILEEPADKEPRPPFTESEISYEPSSSHCQPYTDYIYRTYILSMYQNKLHMKYVSR